MTSYATRDKINEKSYTESLPYKMEEIDSSKIDTATYQRKLNRQKVERIAAEFNERIANEPKLSYRDGKYYVFDGHHTVEARKLLNGGNDLKIVCKVFYDMTREEEAMLFAAQTGISSKPTPGTTLRAKAIGNDREALNFIKINTSLDIQPSFSDVRGKCRLRCINTARREYDRIGARQYKKAMKTIVDAWQGRAAPLLADVVVTVCTFVNIYAGEYSQVKLVKKLSCIDPFDLVRTARTVGEDGGRKKALALMLELYNAGNTKDPLPMKF